MYIIGWLVVCNDYVMNLNGFTEMNNTVPLIIFANNSPMTIELFSARDIVHNKSCTCVYVLVFILSYVLRYILST